MDNTPPSLPLGLPPPLDISGEVAVDVSSEYEEVNTHTPQAWASFLKDKSVSLLCGATAQTFLGPVNTGTAQEEDLDDDGSIVRGVGTLKVASGSVDLFPSFNSGFQLVGSKGYDKATKDVSGRISVDNVTLSVSDEEKEDHIIGFVRNEKQKIISCNVDGGEFKPSTSVGFDSYTCPYPKHTVDKDGDSQRRMTKWINRVLLVSSDDTCGLSKVSEVSGDR